MTTRQNQGRGYQGKMARAAGCPQSYFSQILNANAHLNPEQALRLCMFWNLSDNETEFFLELVNLARTDFQPLVKRIKDRLQVIRQHANDLAERFASSRFLSTEKEVYYYSAWHWSAIHILVGVKGCCSVESVAKWLRLSPQVVRDTLAALEAMGLVKHGTKGWQTIPGNLHLRNDSPMLPIHHANWRERAVSHARGAPADGLHYTVVASHGEADFEQIKQIFLASLDKVRAIIAPSTDEELRCICLDFFSVN